MASIERVYWDSCVWIGLINEEPGRVDSAKFVIERARKGEIEIWTSALTFTEVFKAKCGEGNKALESEKDEEFERLLAEQFVVIVQVDRDIGIEARRLLRNEKLGLKKPNDAVHLATAQWHSLDQFHTYDRADLLILNGKINRRDQVSLNICKPPDRPAAPTILTPPNLQSNLFDASLKPEKPNEETRTAKTEAKEPSSPARPIQGEGDGITVHLVGGAAGGDNEKSRETKAGGNQRPVTPEAGITSESKSAEP